MSENLSPSLAARATACRHLWYLECHGDPSQKLEPDAGTLLRFERGQEWEDEVVSGLEGTVAVGMEGDDMSWEEAQERTRRAMREGADWIYQAALADGPWRGLPDLLRRTEEASLLGEHGYEPVDVKSHKEATEKDAVQLAAYARLLEPVLGRRPARGGILTNQDVIEEVDLVEREGDLDALERELLEIRDGGRQTRSLRCSECRSCAWEAVCRAEWQARGDVCLLYGVSGAQARKLQVAGFETVGELVDAGPEEIARRLGRSVEDARVLHVRARSVQEGRPILLRWPEFPMGVPILYYDIETYGEVTYLHGVIRVHEGRREEQAFLARRPEEEARAWHEFLDYVARDDEAVVWTWTTYENGFAESLWAAHGGNEKGYRVLMDGFRDQCAFVRECVALPTDSYSIKKVAPVFGFGWDAEDAGGLNSESWYGEWLSGEDDAVLGKILRYNLDDVVAMEVIENGLQSMPRNS